MKNQINWGVIGSGGIARRRTIPEGIVPAKNANLISVYDVDEKVNIETAKEFNAIACNSIEELLKSDIDAVYIASPANKHHDQVLLCANGGKHILCEKPLGMTTVQAKTMIKACKDSKVKLGTGFMMRFLAQHQAALKLIENGKLGKCVYGRAQLSCWYPPIPGAWRQSPDTGGGGALMDMGSHCIDLLEMFFGKVKSVNCYINNNVHDYESEDSAVVSLLFENGAMGTVDSYFCIPDNSSKNVLELFGSKGSIIAKGTIGQGDAGEMIAYLESGGVDYDALQAREAGDGIKIEPDPLNTYKAEIEEFSQALLEGREPRNSAEIALSNQIVLSACYESAKTGKSVEIN